MSILDIGEAIAKLGLPLIGAALPIPGGAALGALLASKIGAPSGEPGVILSTLSQNADALAKAQQFELEHTEAMQKLLNDAKATESQTIVSIKTIEAGDTQSAREREEKTGDVWTPRVIAIFILVLFAFVQIYTLMASVPSESRDLAARGMGILDIAVGLVLGYYFGSTMHTARQNELIAGKK
jgi:Fe2+ transport system protein B